MQQLRLRLQRRTRSVARRGSRPGYLQRDRSRPTSYAGEEDMGEEGNERVKTGVVVTEL